MRIVMFCSAACLAVSLQVPASAILIDDFTTPQTTRTWDNAIPGDGVGGYRDILGDQNGAGYVEGGQYTSRQIDPGHPDGGGRIGSRSWLEYDGVDGAPWSLAAGLGPLNLLADGATQFQIDVTSLPSTNWRWRVTLRDGVGNFTSNFFAMDTLGTKVIPFSEFAGADLTNVVGIQLYMEPEGNGIYSPGAFIDNFQTTSAAVPEPSTFALASLGLVGLGWFGYRRRQG